MSTSRHMHINVLFKIYNAKNKSSVFECCGPWDNSMCSKYEGDVLCQSVMSHLNKCISSGWASLAFSKYIHHINVIWQKHHICIADSSFGPKVCESVCACVYMCVWEGVGGCRQKDRKAEKENKHRERWDSMAERVKPRPGGFFIYLHMQILVTPDPYPHQEKPIKTLFI